MFTLDLPFVHRLLGTGERVKDAARQADVEAPGATCLALHPFRPLLVRSARVSCPSLLMIPCVC